MRLAHLILAHSNPDQLERLVKCLSHNEADIYIHIDKKTAIQPFLKLMEIPNVYFIEKRVRIAWGVYSIVEATLNSFKVINSHNKSYSYINLLSGQDYPIQPVNTIHQFLQKNPDKAFMEFYVIADKWKEAIPKIHQYHLAYYRFPAWNFFQKWMNRILPTRKLPYSMVAVGRSQWFTITGEHVSYIVNFIETHPKINNFFKLTWGPDEYMFQTILYNSPYREMMVNNNLRYIDWSAGGVSPKVLLLEDAQLMLASDKLFARKFSNNANDPLLDLIDTRMA